MNILVIMLLLISCSSIKPLSTAVSDTSRKKEVVNVPFAYEHQEVMVNPGKVKFVEFATDLNEGKHFLTCDKEKVPFYVLGQKAKVFFAEGYFSKRNTIPCYIKDQLVVTLVVKAFKYKSEKLNVDKRRVFLNKEDLKRVIKEKEIKANIYKKASGLYLFDEGFALPLDSYITSYYGNKRIFNNKKQSQHLGNDFRAKVGVEIPASNRGRVVFAGNLFYSGNIVIIDHGLDIFTAYGHLSKIIVQEGSIINKGDIVGLAGKTGRVSGPHLHWGVKINGHWVDGFSLVDESKDL